MDIKRIATAAAQITFITILLFATIVRIANAEDVTATPTTQRNLAIAEVYWGQTIPGYRVEVAPVVVTGEPGAVGQAELPGDWQRIDPAFWSSGEARYICVIQVHEFGHSTGHDHVLDPSSVMYYQPAEDSVPGCNEAYPSVEEVAEHKAEAETRAMFARQDARRRHRHHRTGRNHR